MQTNMRQTSLDAYNGIRNCGGLQRRELEVLRAAYAHFLRQKFTRKELAAAMGWEINRITGRVQSLIKKGEIIETRARRDGAYLLRLPGKQLDLF